MKFSLDKCYDLHLHTGPDVRLRKLSDLEQIQQAVEARMAGCVLKCHSEPTAGRAALMRQIYPGFDVIGAVVLNRSIGGINPYAVEAAGKMGAKMLWFPTMDAAAYLRWKNAPNPENGIRLLHTDGTLTAEVSEVLQVAKEYDMVVCTGHIAPEESVALLECAASMGLKRLCVTHVTLPVNRMTAEQLRRCIHAGAFIEFSYCHILHKYLTLDTVLGDLQIVGTEHAIFSSDLGQTNSPCPVVGMQECAELLLQNGIAESGVYQMMRTNPAQLLYGK